MWKRHGRSLLEVVIDLMANAYSKLACCRDLSGMEPFAKPLDIEGNMFVRATDAVWTP
jgi:hypothetical protein